MLCARLSCKNMASKNFNNCCCSKECMDNVSKNTRCAGVFLLIKSDDKKQDYVILGQPFRPESSTDEPKKFKKIPVKPKRMIETFGGKTEKRDVLTAATAEMLEETGMLISESIVREYLSKTQAIAIGFESKDSYLYNVFYLVELDKFDEKEMEDAFKSRYTLFKAKTLDSKYVEMSGAIRVNLSSFNSSGDIQLQGKTIQLPRERNAFTADKISLMRKFLKNTQPLKWDGLFDAKKSLKT